MADLSLDEIIAKKKGLKRFKVQFPNRDGQPTPRFAPLPGQQGAFQQKKSLARPVFSTQRGNMVRTASGPHLAGPGKGQIDARDMITIKTRKKMSDARVKIVQKRIGQRTFDARSRLQPRNRPVGGLLSLVPQHQQQSGFRGGLQSLVPQQQSGFRGGLQSLVPQQQSGFRGGLQSLVPQQQQPGFQSQQRFQVTPSVKFSQPPSLLQVHGNKTRPDLLNFTVAVNPTVPSSSKSRPVEPLTRTLQNPLASGGALVENTGSSLKITRAIPDIVFDGQNLTITRRVPQSSKKQIQGNPQRPSKKDENEKTSAPSQNAPRPRMDSDRGPIIQIQNDQFQPHPVPAPSSNNSARSRQGTSQSGQRVRAPSPVQPLVLSKRTSSKAPRAEDGAVKSSYPADTAAYKVTKTTAVFASKTREPDPQPEERLRSASPGVMVPLKRAAKASSQHPAHSAAANTKLSKSAQSISKRLAPRPSAQSQSGGEGRREGSSKALKRRAPMSLSERFAARESGSSSPVIIDLVPPKKRRLPDPELDKDELEELEAKEERSEEEEEPEVTLISPLQGFRMLVSNLHATVTQDDIIELFGALGPLKRANLLNKGQAEVAYIHRDHAVLALKKYHNRELDGQPMFVKVTTPLNAKVMKPASEDNGPGLPPSLRSSKKAPASNSTAAPVEIPLIHRALFKTGVESVPSKSVRFTVKL